MKQSRNDEKSAQTVVLEDADLIVCILQHASLTPEAFVAVSRVSMVWRAAVRADASLLLSAALSPRFLTKSTFCGLFALSPREADAYPHRVVTRRTGGSMFMYTEDAISSVLPSNGGLEGWKQRLKKRAVYQSSIERAFGPEWRELSQLRRAPRTRVV